MNKKILIRIGLVVLVLAIAGAVFWKSRSTSTSTPSDQSESQTPATLTYGPPPVDWPTYASASMGIKVSFPKGWTHTSCGTVCIMFSPPASGSQPLIGIDVTDLSLATVLEQAAPYVVSKEDVTVNGTVWTKLVLKEPQSGSIFTSHFVEHNGRAYEIGLATQDQDTADLYTRMVWSFSFTK